MHTYILIIISIRKIVISMIIKYNGKMSLKLNYVIKKRTIRATTSFEMSKLLNTALNVEKYGCCI